MKKMPILLLALITLLGVVSCEKLNRPALPKNYPTDNPVTPTTPLRFFVDFDSTSTADAQLNIRFKDSISSYPCFFQIPPYLGRQAYTAPPCRAAPPRSFIT